jgi:transposase-like protein
VNTIEEETLPTRRRRRRYSEEFKAQVVAASQGTGGIGRGGRDGTQTQREPAATLDRSRRTANSPQRILKPFGQGDVALAAKDHVGVLESRTG